MNESRICSKCGCVDVSTAYHSEKGPRSCIRRSEHLHHFCRGCHYDWVTSTLDAKDPKP